MNITIIECIDQSRSSPMLISLVFSRIISDLCSGSVPTNSNKSLIKSTKKVSPPFYFFSPCKAIPSSLIAPLFIQIILNLTMTYWFLSRLIFYLRRQIHLLRLSKFWHLALHSMWWLVWGHLIRNLGFRVLRTLLLSLRYLSLGHSCWGSILGKKGISIF